MGMFPTWRRAPGAARARCRSANEALPWRRWCSTSWAMSSVPPWLCSSPWPCRWPGCASATAGADGGAGAASAPTGARWAAAVAACWPACPSPPSSSCESPKSPPKTRTGRGGPRPPGRGCFGGQRRHRLLIPRRISVTCAFVTSQRVKGQMEPGLGAVPSTLRTLRQHLANVPQVGPRAASAPAWAHFPQGIVWQARGGDVAALKMYFGWQRGPLPAAATHS